MRKSDPIPLFYWSSIRFEGKPKENYGDLLSKYIVERVSGRKIKWIHPKKQPWYKLNKKNVLGIGSIIHHATDKSIVWGSGIIDHKQKIAAAEFKAVRGPQTRQFLLKEGHNCPEIYGDPGLLLPLYYQPGIKKRYRLGIVPHYVDFDLLQEVYGRNKEIKIIDLLTDDIEATTNEILTCEKIISSSLHGMIVAHAYRIPALWMKFSNKIFGNDIKYQDYFESVGIESYLPEEEFFIKGAPAIQDLLEQDFNLPKEEDLKKVQEELLKVCPF